MPKMPAIAIVGATASGKTATSLTMAQLFPSLRSELSDAAGADLLGVEVVSADSRQIYKHLNIGTAKPSEQELASVPHHFIDVKNPDEIYSAGTFGSDAASVVESILARKRVPIIVGGSGLYVKALCEGLFENSVDTSAERIVLEQRLEQEGIASLYRELQEVDAVLAERYNDLNPRRVIRALEYFRTTGMPLSEAHKIYNSKRDFSTIFVGVEVERDTLYRRIDERTAAMFGTDDATGIVAEMTSVLAMGYAPSINALNTVAYKDCMAYLRGDISRLDAVLLAQQSTRHYAKRQLTWFRRQPSVYWEHGTPDFIAQQAWQAYLDYLRSPTFHQHI